MLGNFYIKQDSPVRTFVQGKSAKTLQFIDLSKSTIKLKYLKSIFMLPEV